ncbi:hypothetical protein FRB94_013942, partial [Tulasnella sp. JGI-2019a]
MVVFSFVPTQPRGFFVSSSSSSSWEGIPPPLETTLKSINDDSQGICSLSVGLDSSCFVATRDGNTRYGYTNFDPVLKSIDAFNARDPSASLSIDNFRWISFAPDQEGFFSYFILDDGQAKCLSQGLPDSLNMALDGFDSINCVSMGRNGSWVVLSDDRPPMWEGIPKDLEDQLMQSVPIKSVALALDAEDEYFLEYENGQAYMILPNLWHETINSHLQDVDANALADIYGQQALNIQKVALATAELKATQMCARATLQGLDAMSDALGGYTTRT